MARRIAIPHPRGGTIDVTAPIPAHMEQSWNLLGLDAARYDPIVDARRSKALLRGSSVPILNAGTAWSRSS